MKFRIRPLIEVVKSYGKGSFLTSIIDNPKLYILPLEKLSDKEFKEIYKEALKLNYPCVAQVKNEERNRYETLCVKEFLGSTQVIVFNLQQGEQVNLKRGEPNENLLIFNTLKESRCFTYNYLKGCIYPFLHDKEYFKLEGSQYGFQGFFDGRFLPEYDKFVEQNI